MNNNIKILSYIGFSLLALAIIRQLGIKVEWEIMSGLPIAIPQIVDWMDTLIRKKDTSILELENKYRIKDSEQDALLKQALNLSSKTELVLNQLTKYHELYDGISECRRLIEDVNTRIDKIDSAVVSLSESSKTFKNDFVNWFKTSQGREWR